MSSSKEQSLKQLRLLADEICMTLPMDMADEVTSLLSSAYTAAHTEDPKVVSNTVAVMKNSFDKLFKQIEEGALDPYEDPGLIWLEEHVKEAEPYRGKMVAIDLTQNQIVAAGDDFDDCWDKVEGLAPEIGDRVVLCDVPLEAGM